MTVVALLVTPVIILYQAWTYHVFRARVGGDEPPEKPIQPLAPESDTTPAG